MKWKPIKRLPLKSGRVLVSDGENVGEAIYYAENKNNKFLSTDLNSHYDKVTHWMPLPKAPNEIN